jgi:hypothetical protein
MGHGREIRRSCSTVPSRKRGENFELDHTVSVLFTRALHGQGHTVLIRGSCFVSFTCRSTNRNNVLCISISLPNRIMSGKDGAELGSSHSTNDLSFWTCKIWVVGALKQAERLLPSAQAQIEFGKWKMEKFFFCLSHLVLEKGGDTRAPRLASVPWSGSALALALGLLLFAPTSDRSRSRDLPKGDMEVQYSTIVGTTCTRGLGDPTHTQYRFGCGPYSTAISLPSS